MTFLKENRFIMAGTTSDRYLSFSLGIRRTPP